MMDWYFARWSKGKMSEMMMSTTPIKPEPPRPWMARKAMSMVMVLAAPAPADPIINVTVAKRIIALRPKMSENLPYKGWKASICCDH